MDNHEPKITVEELQKEIQHRDNMIDELGEIIKANAKQFSHLKAMIKNKDGIIDSLAKSLAELEEKIITKK